VKNIAVGMVKEYMTLKNPHSPQLQNQARKSFVLEAENTKLISK
jgi:hypothetical protein